MKLRLLVEGPEDKATPIKMANAIIELVNSTIRPYLYPNALQEIAGYLDIYNTYASMRNIDSIGICEGLKGE